MRLRLQRAALITACLVTSTVQAGETRALIVAGLGGEADYETEFREQASRLHDRLSEVSSDVTLIVGDAVSSAAVHAAFSALARRSSGADTVLFAFVGHGSWDDEAFRFNVPGVDFTAAELGEWLDALPASRQVLIATGASSGALQETLAHSGRTVITGTRSGDQRNSTVFARYFTAALSTADADVDKDGRITGTEAFRYAEASVAQHYSRAGEMSVENPLTSGPEPTLVLARLETAPSATVADAGLLARRDELEQDIASLKSRRDDYSTADYFAELQALLLEMATLEAQLAEKDGAP